MFYLSAIYIIKKPFFLILIIGVRQTLNYFTDLSGENS